MTDAIDMKSFPSLKFKNPDEVKNMIFEPVDAKAREQASEILLDVRKDGTTALLKHAVRLGDLKCDTDKLIYNRDDLKKAYDDLPQEMQQVLSRTAERIKRFAEAQRSSITDTTIDIPGGEAGHFVEPVEVAGCYAPGGRYPLPSSVLMTVVTARVAGVKKVWTASPRPQPATLAAAYIAEADGLLAIGGAQAIGAMAYGVNMPACDVIVGPGNKWVTAAKSIVSGVCAIDMLAGPSEVLVIADDSCDPKIVAADLLAQAEHDTEARPILVCTSQNVADIVNTEIQKQLSTLPTADTAIEAVKKGFVCVTSDMDKAIQISDVVAPEHLEIQTEKPMEVAQKCNHYGAVFVGTVSAEVLGDYGAGPNHVLPTSGTARYTGGLSVFTFLRVRTWMNISNKGKAQRMVEDAVALAREEGLEAHARAAELRLDSYTSSSSCSSSNGIESPKKKSRN